MNRIILVSPNVITRISCHEVETKHRWNKGVEWIDGYIKHITYPMSSTSFPIALQVNSFRILEKSFSYLNQMIYKKLSLRNLENHP